MLDSRTLEWLKNRESDRLEHGGYFCPHCKHFTGEYDPWTGYCDVAVAQCPVESPDWKDCAEFEALLNKRLLEGQEIDMPCSHLPSDFSCPYTKVQLDTPCQPCEWCSLKELRLLVEAEMEDA